MRPHLYCLPVAKREKHRLALRRAATSGDRSFFLGTDSAPHPQPAKETACGCAGIFTAASALELYAEVFDEEGGARQIRGFRLAERPAILSACRPTASAITLRREAFTVPERIGAGDTAILPFRAGETLRWRLVSQPDAGQDV